MAVAPELFRRAMGRFPTGVTILTAVDTAGRSQGLTANSFASVSLAPVLVSVAVQQSARFHAVVLTAGRFAVNVLPVSLTDAAQEFATHGRPTPPAQFDRWPHHVGEHSGSVLFDAALATVECTVWATLPAGDHTLVLGEVQAVHRRPDGVALLYAEARYHRFPGPEPAA